MSPARSFFLALTVFGLVFPTRRFALWFTENGLDFSAFRVAVTVNAATTGMVTSVVIVVAACVVFMISEALARQDPISLVAVPVTVLLGPAVGLPLYLFLRLRPLD